MTARFIFLFKFLVPTGTYVCLFWCYNVMASKYKTLRKNYIHKTFDIFWFSFISLAFFFSEGRQLDYHESGLLWLCHNFSSPSRSFYNPIRSWPGFLTVADFIESTLNLPGSILVMHWLSLLHILSLRLELVSGQLVPSVLPIGNRKGSGLNKKNKKLCHT